jgi:hypothetical protein
LLVIIPTNISFVPLIPARLRNKGGGAGITTTRAETTKPSLPVPKAISQSPTPALQLGAQLATVSEL